MSESDEGDAGEDSDSLLDRHDTQKSFVFKLDHQSRDGKKNMFIKEVNPPDSASISSS